jgi:hypothetical protein
MRPARAYANRTASVPVPSSHGGPGVEAVGPSRDPSPSSGPAAAAAAAPDASGDGAGAFAYIAPPPCCKKGHYGPFPHEELDFEASEGEEDDVFYLVCLFCSLCLYYFGMSVLYDSVSA